MNTSERIKTIKGIAMLLSAEDWPLVDLTLRQFKLRTTDSWEGNSQAYVIKMVQEASDEVLLELAAHLGIESTPRPSALAPSFWKPGHLRLFISHISDQKAEVTNLKTWLHSYNISGFIAHIDIEPTKKWQSEIELALSTADVLVAVLTPGFPQSKWTDQEIGFALGRGLLVISLKMGLDPYGFMGHEQALPCGRELSLPIARQIFEIILRHKQTQKRMSESLVNRFENSVSFAEAKSNIGLLEQAVYWDHRLLDAIGTAAEENGQIKGSFGVADRVAALIKKRQIGG
jgi:TIR domain